MKNWTRMEHIRGIQTRWCDTFIELQLIKWSECFTHARMVKIGLLLDGKVTLASDVSVQQAKPTGRILRQTHNVSRCGVGSVVGLTLTLRFTAHLSSKRQTE